MVALNEGPIAQDRFRGGRAFTLAAVLGAAGLLVLLALYFVSGPQNHRLVLAFYLVGFAYWVGISVAATIWNAIFHASGARWMTVLRRALESIGGGMLPIFAVLFIPVLAGMTILFPWVHPSSAMSHAQLELLDHKAAYLNSTAFVVRALVYFAIWIFVSTTLRRLSLRQDEVGGVEPTARMRRLGSASLPFLGLSITFAAFDWLMSMDPFWYSTIFGAYYWVGSFLAAMAALTLLTVLARNERKSYAALVTRYHLLNLGNLLLAFTAFWTYIAFSQFMLIWIANIPEEASWYVVRMRGGWQGWGILLVITHFIIPFFTLLSRGLKLRPGPLGFLACWFLVVHYIDLCWLVLPAVTPGGPQVDLVWVLAAIAAFVGVGGVAIAFAVWRARGHFTLPVKDPYLSDSLRYTQA